MISAIQERLGRRIPLKARFTAYDCHCEGDVETVVTSGLPELPAGSVFQKMKYLRRHHDDIRRFFLNEPRGSVVRSVNFIVASEHPQASAGYIIAESEEYPVMSGGNTMSVAAVLLKTGAVPLSEPVTRFNLESPAGLIGIECDTADGRIGAVRLVNRPAFVYCLDRVIEVPGFAPMPVDVAFGGMTYVLVDAAHFGFELVPSEGRALCEVGQAIKRAAAEQIPVSHPENPEIAGITQTLFRSSVVREQGCLHSRNAVVVSPGRIDRCPCGTGTSARLAVLHARGRISVGEPFLHRSLIDSSFSSEITELVRVGPYEAVVTAMSGRAWITAACDYVLEADDPFPAGYRIADTWPMDADGPE